MESLAFMDFHQPELDELARRLIKGRARVAAIIGAPATGKTFLAHRLADQFRRRVRGGEAVHAYAWAPAPLERVYAQRLIIVDDYDERHADNYSWWRDHLGRRGNRLVYASRSPLERTPVDFTVTISAPSDHVLNALLARSGLPESETLRQAVRALAGNPAAVEAIVSELGRRGADPVLLHAALAPIHQAGLVDLQGRPLDSRSDAYRRIVTDVTAISDDLLSELSTSPERLYDLHPRKFEELVAELLARQGYNVELTPPSRDGGKDIFAARHDAIGSFLYLVECKRFAPDRPVGVGIVRQLYGVAQAEKATAAILATTSFFTRGAREFQEEVRFQLSLHDYFGIQRWLAASRRDA